MNVSVTLQVSPSVYRLAQRTAQATARAVEKVLSDVISAASPLSEDLPFALQTELEALAQMSDAELVQIARKTFPPVQRRKYDRLLEKNSAGALTEEERAQLKALRSASERLMLHKAHAYALLKWRGHSLPALAKLPRPR